MRHRPFVSGAVSEFVQRLLYFYFWVNSQCHKTKQQQQRTDLFKALDAFWIAFSTPHDGRDEVSDGMEYALTWLFVNVAFVDLNKMEMARAPSIHSTHPRRLRYKNTKLD